MSRAERREIARAQRAARYGERPVPAGPYWTGFNDARAGFEYDNDYATVVAQHEYHLGYEHGSFQTPSEDGQ